MGAIKKSPVLLLQCFKFEHFDSALKNISNPISQFKVVYEIYVQTQHTITTISVPC